MVTVTDASLRAEVVPRTIYAALSRALASTLRLTADSSVSLTMHGRHVVSWGKARTSGLPQSVPTHNLATACRWSVAALVRIVVVKVGVLYRPQRLLRGS